MTEHAHEKHLSKLYEIKDKNRPLSIYDIREGIFKEEIEIGEVTQTQLLKHEFASRLNENGRFVKKDYHDRAFDYVIGNYPYKTDRNWREIYIATIYINTHSDIKKSNRDNYRDNPLYDQRYSINRISLCSVKYCINNPSKFCVTRYKA